MVEPVTLVALALEAAIGWPAALYRRIGHPVGGFARIITACEQRWNRPEQPDATRRRSGVATVLILIGAASAISIAATWLAWRLLGADAWIVIALLAIPGLAQRSLHDHVAAVAEALSAGRIDDARRAVAMIVGRDVERLDTGGIARAAIESLSESFCDGVVAPAFWLGALGLPGLWSYKAINTADSMIGHMEPRWRAFGWAAARTDDGLNLLPARIAGALLCLAAGKGWTVMLRDAGRHASPNAGWPEAAMAGALGLSLGGPVAYDGALQDKPWIGDGATEAGAADLVRALSLYRRACLILWGLAGAIALGLAAL